MARKPRTPKPSATPPPVRESRRRAPVPVILRLQTDLEPNVNHPLAALDSVLRTERREQLIGSILARLATGPSPSAMRLDRMETSSHTEADTQQNTE